MANDNLRQAKENKNDEFYTRLSDIENEIKHYKNHFEGKIVFCNCDDPYESNFFKYFVLNFNQLKLKKLICTCYDGSPIVGEQLNLFDLLNDDEEKEKKVAHKIVINEVQDYNGDGAIDLSDVEYLLKNDKNTLTKLSGNGDFRSPECVELLKESDIVVTNPPFSLFREYVDQLMKYDKKFIILGTMNAISYREFFPLMRDNKVWAGYKRFGGGMDMIQPKGTFDPAKTKSYKIDENGNIIKNIMGVIWFSNLDISKRHESLVDMLYKKYNENDYPKYENYDAINVNKVSEIPYDYFGDIGVPITFLEKHNPDEFEIVGLGISNSGLEIGVRPYKAEHRKYRKEVQHKGAVDGDLYMLDSEGHPDVPYARVVIRRKR